MEGSIAQSPQPREALSNSIAVPIQADQTGQRSAMGRFQCPECGFGDYEVAHLIAEAEIYCVVCLEEDGRLIGLERWDEEAEAAQARLREGLVVVS